MNSKARDIQLFLEDAIMYVFWIGWISYLRRISVVYMNNTLDTFTLQTSAVVPAFVSVKKYSFQLMQLLPEQFLL